MKTRCDWTGDNDLMIAYHDEEWGVPQHDDVKLFEFLILEGAQAGLSWTTILNKRENYRRAFDNFDAAKISRYGPSRVKRLLADKGIVRNRLKIAAAIENARLFLEVRQEHGSFADYVWQFTAGKPRQNSWKTTGDIPAQTPQSEQMSKELKRRGFKFVGPTICYAFMQATGMVNDHLVSCFRYKQLRR